MLIKAEQVFTIFIYFFIKAYEFDFKDQFSAFEQELMDNFIQQKPLLDDISTSTAEFLKINSDDLNSNKQVDAVQKIVDSIQLYETFCMDIYFMFYYYSYKY